MSLRERLHEPVDIASLVFFRVAFGLLMLIEVCRYLQFGWVKRFYIDPGFHFTYYGFGWVRPLPGQGMYYLFAALGVLAFFIMVGFRYRIATVLFFPGFTYVFLIDQARYLNHFYLICLISFLLIFVPAHRAFSVDVAVNPALHSRTTPAWTIWLFRLQFALVYVYGGIAKINGDWLRGSPMRDLLANNSSIPVVGPYLTEPFVVLAFAYGGLFFDLFIVALLLWPKTRALAVIWAALFHGMNHVMFDIGVFPWFAMAGTLLYLPPDWPRRIFSAKKRGDSSRSRKATLAQPGIPKFAVALLAAFFVVQTLLPLRHLFYPGNVNWTDEGHRFSWRMMLRAKQATGQFVAIDRVTRQQQAIDPARHLDREQIGVMWMRPDMILQYAHFAADELRRQGLTNVEIRASAYASLNGRRPQLLTDPAVDLAAQKRDLRPMKWIMPLTEPLPTSGQSPVASAQ